MRKTLTGALASSLLLLMASFLPAKAGVLYSLTGVVGDSNWSPDSFSTLQMFADLSSVFQANGGPGGLITIDFSGPPLLGRHDQIFYEVTSLTAVCIDTSGCVKDNGYAYNFFQGGGPFPGPVPYPIDSSLHVQELEIPPFAPYQASFEGFTEGFVGYDFFGIASSDTIGQPFSLTVNTIPEPAAWPLMLVGIFGIGFTRLRGLKRKSV